VNQILLNYLSNAIKFTNQGEIKVRIDLLQQCESNYTIKCSVVDCGIGLTSEEIPRLFMSFEQADSSTTRKYGGTGLGLAISKQLAHLMGGDVGVTSKKNVGSEFWFTAILQAATETHNVVPTVLGPEIYLGVAKENQYPLLQGLNILLVEDSLFNQQVAQDLLHHVGAKITIANHGREAIEHLELNAFDVILMDLQMPEMDGLEATAHIRLDSRFHNTPIFAMTANVNKEDRERCLAVQMNGFIGKPIQPQFLYKTLHDWIVEHPVCHRDWPMAKDFPQWALKKIPALERSITDEVIPQDLESLISIAAYYRQEDLVDLLTQLKMSGTLLGDVTPLFRKIKKLLFTLSSRAE